MRLIVESTQSVAVGAARIDHDVAVEEERLAGQRVVQLHAVDLPFGFSEALHAAMVDECRPLVGGGSRQAQGEVGIVEAAVSVFPGADDAHFAQVRKAPCDFIAADPFGAPPAVAACQQSYSRSRPRNRTGPAPLDGMRKPKSST